MRNSVISVLMFIVVFFSFAANRSTFSDDEVKAGVHKIVTLKLKNYRKDLIYIYESGFDIAGVNQDAGTIDVVISGDELASIQAMLPVQIAHRKAIDTLAAPDSQYSDYDETTAFIQSLQTQFPNLVKVEEIGRTLENRAIWAVKVSDQVAERESNEPVVFFNSMHHAREVMTTEVAIDTLQYLTSNYGSDERVTKWVDTTEIWIVPMVNPDGNHKVWHSNSMWRKNARGDYGVDINRNYPYRWGQCNGSSEDQNNDSFRGAGPASEPETQAMVKFIGSIKPAFSISYHSYSELVLYPLSCQGSRTVDRDLIEGLGQQMAALLPSDNGSGKYRPGTPWDILYPVDGGDIDWMHAVHQVIPYVIELNATNQGFQPSFSAWRDRTVQKARAAWMMILDRVHKSGIYGQVSKDGVAVPFAKVKAYSAEHPELVANVYTAKQDGSFQVVLNPGNYILKVKNPANGREKTERVTVGAELENIEVNLEF